MTDTELKGIPQRLGKFQILKRIASGGMGDIFLARLSGAAGFEREVALKVLHGHLARDGHFARELADEAKITVLLHHPNIVQMYDLEKAGDLLYCVMEYVPGRSVASIQRIYRRKGGVVPVRMALAITLQSLEGLAYAHEMTDREGNPLGIVHRDISPQNILVTQEGWVKIIDFGIAKAATRLSQTIPGTVKGKFAYMSPEQFEGRVDARSDLFSLGIVLWEMLMGQRLFRGENEMDTLGRVVHMPAPAVSPSRPEVNERLDAVLLRSLAKNPEARFQSAREFRAELMKLVHPETADELRSSVDIDGALVAPDTVLDEKALFADITPQPDSVDLPLKRSIPAVRHGTATRQWRPWMLVAVLPFLGLGGWWLGTHLGWLGGDSPGGPQATERIPQDPPRLLPALLEPAAADGGSAASDSGTVALPDAGLSPAVGDATPISAIDSKAPPAYAVRGRLTQAMIDKVVQRNAPRLQACADAHLLDQGFQEIALQLQFTVSSTGKVTAVSIEPPALSSGPFGTCLLNRVRGLQFPPHQDRSATITFPLKFRAASR